jgi:hypothetical protein
MHYCIEIDREYKQFYVLKYRTIYVIKTFKIPAEYKFHLRQLQFKRYLSVNSASAGVLADTPHDIPLWGEKRCNGVRCH